jgi:Ca2+-binding EF-hand superfamily protein
MTVKLFTSVRIPLAIAALTVFASGIAMAQSTAPAMTVDKSAGADMSAMFAKADANKDGKLDKVESEGVPGLSARFEQIDSDGDKMISKSEFDKATK